MRGWIWWDWTDWSLSVRQRGTTNWYNQLFSLKCGECRHFTWGCGDHFFCGLCPGCRAFCEPA